ncbi:hypothetical protein [Pseudomonas aeruginosa]|uniref:hypothetical protein n=1 Tax=Pseudomonas aeruginosa TaxID=287 RepID=UPI003D267712
MNEMKRYYSFFTSQPGDWRPCSKEHHDMVRANPQDWPGYEVRELAVIPAGHVVVPRELVERAAAVLNGRLKQELRALLNQDKENGNG